MADRDMTDRPLILPDWAVRACLDGRKTQHRVPLKNITTDPHDGRWRIGTMYSGFLFSDDDDVRAHAADCTQYLPYAPGDRLWIRETWENSIGGPEDVSYRATVAEDAGPSWTPPEIAEIRWRSSATMPRWASRLTLLVDDVRVQRVQDISEEDAIAEGVEPLFSPEIAASRPEFHRDPMPWLNYLWHGHHDLTRKQVDAWRHQYSSYDTAVGSFSSLWERQHGPGAWGRNDWVVALTFRPIPRNIDMEA